MFEGLEDKVWEQANYFIYLVYNEGDYPPPALIPFDTLEEMEAHIKEGHDEEWIEDYTYMILEGKIKRFTEEITHTVKINIS